MRWGAWAAMALAAITVVGVSACGATAGGGAATTKTNVSATTNLMTTTPAGTKTTPSVLWAVYRDVNSLDPVFAYDYPENTADTLFYESLLRQAPDGTIGPGMATLSYTNPTTLVFTLKPGLKFWDGNPVTPDDVVFSLKRNTDPSVGGFYGFAFTRVKSIAATGAQQVTMTLTQPDYWLPGELSGVPGMVLEKSFTKKQGKNYGTPAGAIMGTGAYKFASWNSGVGVTAVANPNYWNPAVKPLAQKIVIKGVPTAASLASGLLTGAIQGSYLIGDLTSLKQLEQSPAVKVYKGVGGATDSLVICSYKGVLGDVRARQALSLAVDRRGEIAAVYQGAALVPHWPANPGTFGYGKAVFEAAYNQAPAMTQNLTKAKQLAQAAGIVGRTITIGMTNQVISVADIAAAYQAAGEAIGLKVRLKAFSAQNYIYLFTDPKARAGVDAFPTVAYGDYADPAAMLATFVLPGDTMNYGGYSNPEMSSLLEQARGTADPNKRAELVAKAESLAAQELPFIPTAQPESILVMSKSISGAVASFAYMGSPWADQLGGTP